MCLWCIIRYIFHIPFLDEEFGYTIRHLLIPLIGNFETYITCFIHRK